eukprot:6366544-Amphidinium_carterae.1
MIFGPWLHLWHLAAALRETAVTTHEKIIRVDEPTHAEYLAHVATCQAIRAQMNIKEPVMLKPGTNESA